uniref:Uncharacterized protein n=1 Tax=Arundo donax TaxID=35708 RepID=A0A0A9BTQ0_ARUDO
MPKEMILQMSLIILEAYHLNFNA